MQNVYISVQIFIIAFPVLFIALIRIAVVGWYIYVNAFRGIVRWEGVEGLL